ncbi:Hypothetical protein SSCIU_02774 [Mammaliicoccus sciuri]|nr:Hypothetical protein SSCIU_02774 [Mammaliicoccus sciuri]
MALYQKLIQTSAGEMTVLLT